MKVYASAKFPLMKPAHNAFICKSGEGSSFFIACRDALLQISKDTRLKGKKLSTVSPCLVTFTVYNESNESGE